MQYANVNDNVTSASPGLIGKCKHCSSLVHARCGQKNIWHWAHINTENCDSWYEPETQWHRDWKNIFEKEFSEVRITKGYEFHIADVRTKNGVVIEFQNSTISTDTIVERETFYGEKMLWVINGSHFKKNFIIREKEFFDEWYFQIEVVKDVAGGHKYPRVPGCIIPGDKVKKEHVKKLLLSKGFRYNPHRNTFTYPVKDISELKILDLEMEIYKELIDLYAIYKSKDLIKKCSYTWSWARRSWQVSQRPVFVDFGENFLFRITTQLGFSAGDGSIIDKTEFIKKYSL